MCEQEGEKVEAESEKESMCNNERNNNNLVDMLGIGATKEEVEKLKRFLGVWQRGDNNDRINTEGIFRGKENTYKLCSWGDTD